ncbi:MAG: pirin family protein [Polaromonas sp.]|uniref:pirin family protein n=1 Tax=Polaromonas sp. TaxID=1869339 RepID=UPI0025F78C58|nr:pirin family protein [Polaromonas sp.]MBI2725669.1 pirin family protein [Polaromonas sp.]
MSSSSAGTSPILNIKPLGPRWETLDPFLFCVYHDDAYPEANADMSPKASLAGRDIGQDFSRKDGWSMYHGQTVPGFPGHPHRGFETVSIVRKGLIDHSDSLGAIARFGQGDVQWLTAGRGIVHAEMFPLLKEDTDNRMEMFQIWLNLPAVSKMAPPHFKMFWAEDIPDTVAKDEQGRATHVSVVAGKLKAGNEAIDPLAPPPDSWAAREHADLAIWTLRMEPGAKWTLPAAAKATNRVLYFFKGKSVTVAGQAVNSSGAIQLQPDVAVELVNGDTVSEFLVLQGKPIGEPVVQYGPFVMNSQAEIVQTMQEYQRTQFGGWPWGDYAPTHGRDPARFAKHPDGKEDRPQAETAAA